MRDILLLDERQPLLREPPPERSCFRVSRRYSVVGLQVSLLALNVFFLICKADKKIPREASETALLLLSTVGVIFLHYPIDAIWKSIQDTRFALKVKNYPIATLAAVTGINQMATVALTLGNFAAAVSGVAFDTKLQGQMYHDMIVPGEVFLGVGMAVTACSTCATYFVHQKLQKGEGNPAFVATLRYCMDKDTLWHLVDKLECLTETSDLSDVMQVIKTNVATQLNVTLGPQIVLIIIGYALQAVEKAYTPNSMVSAVINCSVSSAYAIKIFVEKGMEYRQRARLDLIP